MVKTSAVKNKKTKWLVAPEFCKIQVYLKQNIIGGLWAYIITYISIFLEWTYNPVQCVHSKHSNDDDE